MASVIVILIFGLRTDTRLVGGSTGQQRDRARPGGIEADSAVRRRWHEDHRAPGEESAEETRAPRMGEDDRLRSQGDGELGPRHQLCMRRIAVALNRTEMHCPTPCKSERYEAGADYLADPLKILIADAPEVAVAEIVSGYIVTPRLNPGGRKEPHRACALRADSV